MLVKNHQQSEAHLTIVEIGGTVGDYESSLFLHAVARMQSRYKVASVFLGYFLRPPHINEMKTKPYQHALMNLMSFGIRPSLYVVRAPTQPHVRKLEKIAAAANATLDSIITIPDTRNIYEIPKLLYTFTPALVKLLKPLALRFPKNNRTFRTEKAKYTRFLGSIKKIEKQGEEVRIAIVGKYTKAGRFTLKDSYISVVEAIRFAAWKNKVRPHIVWIDALQLEKAKPSSLNKMLGGIHGIIVPGGFGSTGVEGKIRAITFARTKKIPYLGLCYGLQLAVIEFARNVAKLTGANSTEIDPKTPHPVIDILPRQRELLSQKQYGATMRLGEYKAYLKKGTLVYNLYKQLKRLQRDLRGEYVVERHRHRYEVNPKYHETLQRSGIIFSGLSADKTLVEFIELPSNVHPFFVATQAHPEFTSYPTEPNPLFYGLIKAARGAN